MESGSIQPSLFLPVMASRTRVNVCARCMATRPRSRSHAAAKAVQSQRCECRIAKCVRSQTVKHAKWKALIADDEPAARRGVRQLLASFTEFVVAGECSNGAEVLAA